MPVRRMCLTCHRPFWARPSSHTKYCSRECVWKAQCHTMEEQFERDGRGTPNEHGCIIWAGDFRPNGYGYIQYKPRGKPRLRISAHRFAYEYTHGSIPSGLFVLHTCEGSYPPGDVTSRGCVNPAHLRLGDQAENMEDMKGAERQARGEANAKHVLTEEEVLQIREIHKTGKWTTYALGDLYGVSRVSIGNIIKRRTWKHL